MAEWADITSFYEWLNWLEEISNFSYPDHQTLMFYEIRDKLDDLPRATRCIDCQSHEPCEVRNRVWCSKMGRYMKEDGFCSEGERQ